MGMGRVTDGKNSQGVSARQRARGERAQRRKREKEREDGVPLFEGRRSAESRGGQGGRAKGTGGAGSGPGRADYLRLGRPGKREGNPVRPDHREVWLRALFCG